MSWRRPTDMQRFSAELRERPNRSATFETIEQLTGQWEARFRQYCEVVQAEFELFRQTQQATARYMVASHSANLTSRVVNLSNGVVLLLNRRNLHSVGAVAGRSLRAVLQRSMASAAWCRS